MSDTQIMSLIKPYFQDTFEYKLQEAIGIYGKLMHFSAGEIILNFGQYVKLIPLVIKGSIKVIREDEDGNELFLYYLNEGDTCPMSFSCCMIDKQSNIKTIAEDDVILIGIPIDKMELWMSEFKTWKNFIFKSYENRMNTFLDTIDGIAFKKLDDRLITYLEQKAKALRTNTIQITHQEIANDLNSSREVISRLLKKLEKEQFLQLGRHKIVLM